MDCFKGRKERTYRVRVNNIVAVSIVSSGADGMGTSDISGGVGNDWQTSGHGTTEPIRCESLVTEDRAETIGRKLSSGAISKELENKRYFGESSEDTSDVELKLKQKTVSTMV